MLYLGAAVLLGAASEGAWLELAMTVSNVPMYKVPRGLEKALGTTTPSIEIVQKRTRDAILADFRDAMKKADTRPGEFEQVMETGSYYRRLRNYAIHFQHEELDQLNHATVGILLLNATDYFNFLYRLRNAVGAPSG